jgi:hypothetical protein
MLISRFLFVLSLSLILLYDAAGESFVYDTQNRTEITEGETEEFLDVRNRFQRKKLKGSSYLHNLEQTNTNGSREKDYFKAAVQFRHDKLFIWTRQFLL